MCYNRFMAYSSDFRQKAISYYERTKSVTETAAVFEISRNTLYEWIKLKKRTGKLNHQVKGPKPRKIDREKLIAYFEEHPDAYLTEAAVEFNCHPTAIHYALKAIGYTRKKRIVPTTNKTQKK